MKRYKQTFFLALLFSFASTTVVQGGNVDSRLEALLQELDPEQEVAVIITMNDQLNSKSLKKSLKREKKKAHRAKINRALRGKSKNTQQPVQSFLKRKKAQRVIPFWVFNGMAATIRADQVRELAVLPGVGSVGLDAVISIDPSIPSYSGLSEWNLDAVRAPAMWADGYTGNGITIASMDTGVDVLHPDLAATFRGDANSWYDPNGQHATPYDSNGHGTQTMGIMVGRDNGGTAIGMAPDARWIAVKMFNDAGYSSYSTIHQGFQWLLDPDDNPDTDDLPDIVNNSWGYPQLVDECFTEFQADIQNLKAVGVAVVFSAGNMGPLDNTSESPANYPESFAVGAVDDLLTLGDFSSRGPSACGGGLYPHLVAPGINVRTSDRTFGGVFPDSYVDVRGTSFAAPHVSGSMALLLSAEPNLTVEELESALTGSTYDPLEAGPNNDHGNGLVDVAAAWDFAQANGLGSGGDGGSGGGGGDGGCITEVEIKHDGIDQDCNGYDLTIVISRAKYIAAKKKLVVQATSSLGSDAGLTLDGYGPMRWNNRKSKWVKTIKSVTQDPLQVTVTGIEGSESSNTKSK